MRSLSVLLSTATTAALVFSAAAISTASAAGYSFVTINSTGGDGDFTQLLGINNAGAIAGYFGDGSVVPNNGFTVKSPYGSADFTAQNVPGAVQTQVIGINNIGTTVGFAADAAGDNIGFVYKGGVFTPVINPNSGTVPTTTNQLLGVNDSNIAAGFYVDAAGVTQGELVNVNGPSLLFQPVTVPASYGPTATTATDVNNAGDVSGFFTNAAGNTIGFLIVGTTFIPLNDPFGNSTSTMAFGLNNENEVVGSFVGPDDNNHGFVYNWITNNWTTVDDPNANGNTSFGVEGTFINGVNDKGQLVGFYADNVNGFLANPVPEPSTWATMMIGFSGLVFLGYRAQRRRDSRLPAATRA